MASDSKYAAAVAGSETMGQTEHWETLGLGLLYQTNLREQ